jgi:hypothetical protein
MIFTRLAKLMLFRIIAKPIFHPLEMEMRRRFGRHVLKYLLSTDALLILLIANHMQNLNSWKKNIKTV